MTEIKTLRAIQAVDKIMAIITDLEDGEIKEALDKLSLASTTWGLLWGNPVSGASRMDIDFYELKLDLLQRIEGFRNQRNYPLVILVMAQMKQRGEITGFDECSLSH
jgi:hypothetical protein